MPIYLLIIIIFGLLTRIYNLGRFGFWYDESICLFIANHFQDVFSAASKIVGSDGTTFIILLKGWMFLFHNDYFLRLFSVLCGVFSIIIIYYLGKFIFSRRIGILSALLLSISPLHVFYSQELTYYSLSVLLALASTYYFLKLLKSPSNSNSILYVILTLGFVYNHPINPILIFVQNLFFYIFYYKEESLKKRWLIIQLIIICFSLPWIITVASQFLRFSQLNLFFWIPKPTPGRFLQTFMIFSLGYHASWALQFTALIILLISLAYGVFYWRKKNDIFYLIFWLIIPPGIIWLISQRQSFYLYRVFLFSLPAFCLLVASGIAKLHKYLRVGLLAIYFILTIFSLSSYYGNKLPLDYENRYSGVWPKKDYKKAALYLSRNFQDGDVIFHICRSSFMPFNYYHKGELPEYGIRLNDICREDWIKVWVNDKLPKGPIMNNVISIVKNKDDLRNYKRIWLIYSYWNCDGLTYLPHDDDVGKMITGWFSANFSMKDFQMFEGLNIYLFSVKE
jgi:mannosyltransferase